MKKSWRIIKLIIGVLYRIIIHIIKRILSIIYNIVFFIIADIIAVVFFEPKKVGKPTIMKARRIRFLSKMKLYLWKYFSFFFKFIGDTYLEKFYNRLHFLIEK